MIIDISQSLSPGMAGFPGDAAYEESWTFRIDVRGAGPLCLPDAILPHLDSSPPRILLRLEDKQNPKKWPTGFRAVAPETMSLLAQRGTVLVGIDTPSVDPEISKDLGAHMAARRADMRILENLVLAHVAPGDYELIALPMKFENLDASPVRAVLRRP
jgi:arylformamidase